MEKYNILPTLEECDRNPGIFTYVNVRIRIRIQMLETTYFVGHCENTMYVVLGMLRTEVITTDLEYLLLLLASQCAFKIAL